MVIFRYGKIVNVNKEGIWFESNNTGYLIKVSNVKEFELNTEIRLYLLEFKNDYYQTTYGFKEWDEKNLFIDLFSVKGIGPRQALDLLHILNWKTLAYLIATNNKEEIIKKLRLSSEVAENLLCDLHKHWFNILKISPKEVILSSYELKINEIKENMKMLGYKESQINLALKNIKITSNTETNIEKCIKEIFNLNKK